MMVQINEMVMKKVLFAFLICFSFSNIYAQSEKELKERVESNQKYIRINTSKKEDLRAELDTIEKYISLIENRSFSRESPEQKMEKWLAGYVDVQQFVKDNRFQQRLMESQISSQIKDAYTLLVDMYNSLQKNGGYVKVDNDKYKNKIDDMRSILTPLHKGSFMQSFESIATLINDYRFTMYELVRVFELVEDMVHQRMKKDEIEISLRNDGEIVFIEKIPSTKKLLQEYIDLTDVDIKKRLDIRNKVFSTIKE